MKTCTLCKKEKDDRQFYKNRNRPMPRCMDCHRTKINIRFMVGKHKVREEMNMITVNLSEYKLRYFRKSDDREFLARRVSGQEYVLYDPIENKKVHKTNYFLKKEFVSDSDNFQRVKNDFELRVC